MTMSPGRRPSHGMRLPNERRAPTIRISAPISIIIRPRFPIAIEYRDRPVSIRGELMTRATRSMLLLSVLVAATAPIWVFAQPGSTPQGARQQFPGGTNPDGSLRPSRPVTSLFTQDSYTQYEILAPGSEQFRI